MRKISTEHKYPKIEKCKLIIIDVIENLKKNLSKIRDLIYVSDYAGDIEIWHAFLFCVDKPHIIHIDDRIDTLPLIYKAFTFPLRLDGGVEEPYLMFFDQFYLDGPSKFFKGESNKTKGHHEALQFSDLPRSMCVYDYSNVIGTTEKPLKQIYQ